MVADFGRLAASAYHSMVVKQDGTVWGTGSNDCGQLGDGTNSDRSHFVQVVANGASAVAVGEEHSLVLMHNGSVWATGGNSEGQLGDGTSIDAERNTFFAVLPHNVRAVAVGAYHSMVIMHDGSVWAAGWNQQGQLGDGSASSKNNFIQVLPSDVVAIAAGTYHSMVVKRDGSVWAAGWNDSGQFGDGSATSSSSKSFVKVFSAGAMAVAAGPFHSMVLKQDGSVWATGPNNYGQLGDDSITATDKFVQVITIIIIKKITKIIISVLVKFLVVRPHIF